jgi:hypothetical protein
MKIKMKRLTSFLIITTLSSAYAGQAIAGSKLKRTPTSLLVRHLVVTESSFDDRLSQALSLLKDPAVTVETLPTGLRRVTLKADGQAVSCVDGVQQDSPAVGHAVSECDFDLTVTPSSEIEGPFSALIIQALGLYHASNPGDDLAFQNGGQNGAQNGGSGGSLIQLGSTNPTQSLLASSSMQFAAGFPKQALVCHSLTPVGSPIIYDCSFYLYGALDKSDASALYATLSADSKYAAIIKADENFLTAQGFAMSGLQVWKTLAGRVKTLATYSKAPSRSTHSGGVGMGRVRPGMSLAIEADTSPADGKGYIISGVYLGR